MGHILSDGSNLLTWATTRKVGCSFSVPPNATGTPILQRWYAGTLEVNTVESAWTLRLIDSYTSIMWINSTTAGIWNGWVQIATATKPQVYDLPIWNGYEAVDEEPAAYRKTQNGRCYVYGEIKKADGTLWESGASPAGLPEGYRPPCHIVRPCFFSSGGLPNGYGHLHLYHDGRMVVEAVSANTHVVLFDIAFWAT